MMGRILLIVVLCGCLAACSKSDIPVAGAISPQQLAADTVLIRSYINSSNATGFLPDVSNGVATGVYYKIDTLGTGNALFTSSTLVTGGYQGSVMGSSTIFAQTSNFHPSFSYGQMILGWQYGIRHIKTGGTVRLLIPSGYAYGPYPQSTLGLPANAILDFTIKLYNISN